MILSIMRQMKASMMVIFIFRSSLIDGLLYDAKVDSVMKHMFDSAQTSKIYSYTY